MATVVHLVHLPGLQLEQDKEDFAGMTLYALPVEEYNDLTLGAFEASGPAYAKTRPVFLAWTLTADLSEESEGTRASALLLKRPFKATRVLSEVGLEVLDRLFDGYIDVIVTKAWASLSLAYPSASFISPRYSVTFVRSKGGVFQFQGEPIHTIQQQGGIGGC